MAKKSKPVNPWPEILSALRTRTGWTQQQAAEALRLKTRKTWNRWEAGTHEPDGVSTLALECLIKIHAKDLLEKLSK